MWKISNLQTFHPYGQVHHYKPQVFFIMLLNWSNIFFWTVLGCFELRPSRVNTLHSAMCNVVQILLKHMWFWCPFLFISFATWPLQYRYPTKTFNQDTIRSCSRSERYFGAFRGFEVGHGPATTHCSPFACKASSNMRPPPSRRICGIF